MRSLTLILGGLLMLGGAMAAAQNKSGSDEPIPEREEQPIGQAPEGLPPLIGQYSVDDGPSWFDPGTVAYTCQEGCVEVFGGSPQDYSCSTVVTAVDHLAWASSWGSGQHCLGGTPIAEDFKIGGPTNCEFVDCYKSAYVSDWCGSDSVNYCFQAQPVPTMPGSSKILLALLLLTGAVVTLTRKSSSQRS